MTEQVHQSKGYRERAELASLRDAEGDDYKIPVAEVAALEDVRRNG